MNSTTAGTMHSGSFRVKTAKHVSRVVANNRKLSAVETKKDNFQVNFRLVDSKSSHHRNCQACCRRASTVASSHKLRRGQKYLNPEMVF
jgi:PBP1b-binding outer membrane lipoprotein LpoB